MDLDFGKELGTVNGITAYSSHFDDNSNSIEPVSYLKGNYVSTLHVPADYNIGGIFTGLKWQCVEFARRYLILKHNIVFDNVDNAYQIFNLPNFYSLDFKIIVPIIKCKNGSNIRPIKGSVLIWSNGYENNTTGHVAIITNVNGDSVEIGEQNWRNKKWVNNYSRKLDLKYNNGFYIIDDLVLGWINY